MSTDACPVGSLKPNPEKFRIGDEPTGMRTLLRGALRASVFHFEQPIARMPREGFNFERARQMI